MNDYLAIFVAGVLTGVAIVIIARLTPDVARSVRHLRQRLRERRPDALNVPLFHKWDLSPLDNPLCPC